MQTPFWRNIVKAEMLSKKNRYVLTYMSVFFIMMFIVIILSSFKPINEKNQLFFPDTDDTIYVYDTVYYYDTTYYYDTIYISNKIVDTTNIVIRKSIFPNLFKDDSNSHIKLKKDNKLPYGKYLLSLDFSISPMFFNHSFTSDFIYKDISKINKSSVQEELSRNFGFGINYHHQHTTLGSGIFFSDFKERFNYLVTDYLVDTVYRYRYFPVMTMKIDSIKLINIDTLLATGDTVYYYYKDTSYIPRIDSAMEQNIDSVKFKKNDKARNSYKFIEIPLIFSFNFYRNNMSISPQIGIISSFFVNSNGKIVSLANINQSVDIEEEAKFSKVNLSIYGGVRVNYFLSRRFDFFTSAYFRKSLNSIFIDYPIISRFNTYGLSFGIRYKLIY